MALKNPGGVEISPLGSNEKPNLSPEKTREIDVANYKETADKLAAMRSPGPSVRQRTMSEFLNLQLLARSLGGSNPFAIRHIPFTVLRDMTVDSMIAYGFYYTITPLVNAEMIVDCEDSQLAAAVDFAFRPINAQLTVDFAQSLYYGYQAMVKEWEFGPVTAKYRDRHSEKPEEDKEVWASDIEVLLPKPPMSLPPENVIPKWDERGGFNGFLYSSVPIPDPTLIGATSTYGPGSLQGYDIPLDHALWVTNEREETFGSIYGAPRTRRAYRYWWTYWFRWALADRAFEKKADPALLVYYPTDQTDVLNANDLDPENPTVVNLAQKAIETGRNIRSGTVAAIPGDFMTGEDGKTLAVRKWEAKYIETQENFAALSESFKYLDIAKLRAMLLPEQAFLDSNVTGQGSSQRYVATQMGEIYQESQQYLVDGWDGYKNKFMLPQFIARAFPDKMNVPCKIRTGGLGTKNDELNKQLLTIIGQKNPEDIPVNVRALLSQYGVPVLTKSEQDAKFKKAVADAKIKEPEVRPPTASKEGRQGYNAGVEKTQTGESIYVNGPQVINLASHQDFLHSLPNIPPYREPTVRSAALRLRKMMLDRYKEQIQTFAGRLRDKITMTFAEEEEKKQHSYGAGAAAAIAGGAVAAWLAEQRKDRPEVATKMVEILSQIVVASGRSSLKGANLDASVYSPQILEPWVHKYTEEALDSIDNTLRSEFVTFITEELQRDSDTDKLAQAFEDRFSETPQTHADRISRHQARDAFNMGMLQAAVDAGISQVLAHDASDGADTDTDKPCVLRNGKVFTPQEAMLEREHPNGTLYFTYLTSENLSLQITDDIPLEIDEDVPGAYDPKTETLYVKQEFKEDAPNWMLALGEKLCF